MCGGSISDHGNNFYLPTLLANVDVEVSGNWESCIIGWFIIHAANTVVPALWLPTF